MLSGHTLIDLNKQGHSQWYDYTPFAVLILEIGKVPLRRRLSPEPVLIIYDKVSITVPLWCPPDDEPIWTTVTTSGH